jgi:cell division protein FtsI/penicillin-binding protein 2
MFQRTTNRLFYILIALALLSSSAFGVTTNRTKHRRRTSAATVPPATKPASKVVRGQSSAKHLSRLPKELVVRRAAVQALGPYNGSVVVADPTTGRLLTIVNQRLAYQSGFQPCSTIKIVAALAGLSEGVLTEESHFRMGGRRSMDLTEALAHSNNAFFSSVGYKLGYNRIVQYAQLFGLGEKAGLNLDAEQPGTIAGEPPSDGVGMMTSFGEGIYMTPLELAALMSAVANGGTLYYLQHPHSPGEIAQFTPRAKRQLDIGKWVPDIRPGMMGAVEYGTARRANFDPNEPIFGKTGTCTDGRSPTHLGWFGSYNEMGDKKLVVVVLLTGGRPVNGPVASGVAGAVYKNLSQENYFAQTRQARFATPVALISTQSASR